MAKFKLGINGEGAEAFEVTRQGNQICVARNDEGLDSQTTVFQILHQEGDRIVLQQEMADGSRRQFRLAGHRDGDDRQLWVNGRLLTYQRIRERAAAVADDASLAASIPAIVSDILVSEGDVVAAGDKLILLESMKMIIPIQAPYDGIIEAINCTIGDSVQAGVPLIELAKESE